MPKQNKKWKEYEETTYKVVKGLKPTAQVCKDVRISGKLSKVKRQVDVQIVEPSVYDFLAMECKDLSRPVDVPIIEAFHTKLSDIGTKRGAVVANSPYTEGSQNMAEALGIDLLHVIDTDNKDIKTKLYANAVISDTMVAAFKVAINFTSSIPAAFSQNPKDLRLGTENGEEGTAYRIFAELWNLNDSPLSKIPGVYKYVPKDFPKKYIIGVHGEWVPADEISFIYEVVEKHFIGPIEIIQAKGLYDVRRKTFQSKEIVTQHIVPWELEQKWKQITDAELKALDGGYTFGMSIASLYPSEGEEN